MPSSLHEFLFPPAEHRFDWEMGMADRLGVLHILRDLDAEVALCGSMGDVSCLTFYKLVTQELRANAVRRAANADFGPSVGEALARFIFPDPLH